MLLPLNKENIPNLAGISELYLDKEYDPGNVYSVPYMWCMVGITYNCLLYTSLYLSLREKRAAEPVPAGGRRRASGYFRPQWTG